MRVFRFFFITLFFLGIFFPIIPALAEAKMGDLIKCPDFSSVYYFAQDGQRYVFPNEHIYFSWYEDFVDVKTIACDDLASLTLAGAITYQAGTRLVKFPTSPTVYAVEPQGKLRPLVNENQASELYGVLWAYRVDDLSDAFFSHYEVGAVLEEKEIPQGTVFLDEDGSLWRMQDHGILMNIDTVIENGIAIPVKNLALETQAFEDRTDISLTSIKSQEQESLEQLLEDFQTVSPSVFIDISLAFEEVGEEKRTTDDDSIQTDDDLFTQEEYDMFIEDLEKDLEELDEQTQQIEDVSDEAKVLDDTL